jgi:hypothetical protein
MQYYRPPAMRRNRQLGSSDLPLDPLESVREYLRHLSDENVRMEHMRMMLDLPIGDRSNATFDKCQFINNTLKAVSEFPTLTFNGVFRTSSSLADITMNECLFRDNFYGYRGDFNVSDVPCSVLPNLPLVS